MATLVTGGDSGIGRAVALAFAREGADVLISYLSEDQDAEKAGQLVEDAGRKAICVRGDIQDPAHCRELWSMILDGLSYREMGVRLAVAEGTLRVRVLRCRQQAVARWAQVTDPRPGRREDRGAEEEGVANGL